MSIAGLIRRLVKGTPLTATEHDGNLNAIETAVDGKQPLDSDLTSIAALTTTSYGRSQLALADAAADTAQLNAFSSTLKGLAPLSGGGTTNFLRADGTWAAPPGSGGSGSTTLEALTDVNVSAKVNKSVLYYDSVSGKWLGDNIQTITEVTNGGNF